MRYYFIRLTAVCFMLLGLWNIFLFIQRMVTDHTNFAYALAAIILFRTGDNLFSFHEIGRKFAIGILGLNVLQTLFTGFLVATSGTDWSFSLAGWIIASSQANGKFLLTPILIFWITIDLLLGLLLLQKKTRLMFQPNKLLSDPAPAQKPAAPL